MSFEKKKHFYTRCAGLSVYVRSLQYTVSSPYFVFSSPFRQPSTVTTKRLFWPLKTESRQFSGNLLHIQSLRLIRMYLHWFYAGSACTYIDFGRLNPYLEGKNDSQKMGKSEQNLCFEMQNVLFWWLKAFDPKNRIVYICKILQALHNKFMFNSESKKLFLWCLWNFVTKVIFRGLNNFLYI